MWKKVLRLNTFPLFNFATYNQTVKDNNPIIEVDDLKSVHPLLKLILCEIEIKVLYRILYYLNPSSNVIKFIN